MEMNIEFERECYKCYGGSRWSGENCDNCANTGRVATQLGDELMEFLKNQKQREEVTASKEQCK